MTLPLHSRRKGQGPKAKPAGATQAHGHPIHATRKGRALLDFMATIRGCYPDVTEPVQSFVDCAFFPGIGLGIDCPFHIGVGFSLPMCSFVSGPSSIFHDRDSAQLSRRLQRGTLAATSGASTATLPRTRRFSCCGSSLLPAMSKPFFSASRRCAPCSPRRSSPCRCGAGTTCRPRATG